MLLKELVDNALDACEETDVAPVIEVIVGSDGVTVLDNGPGIAPGVVSRMLDFAVRVSSREAYGAPDRGAQGNALKTIIAMPFVLDGARGQVEIEAHGIRHTITVGVDRIRQEPALDHRQSASDVTAGTAVTVWWPYSASSILGEAHEEFFQIARGFAFLNPHLTLTLDWGGERSHWAATSPSWEKWRPISPTSAHWYRQKDFERLIAAYLDDDGARGKECPVREFAAEFRGFSGSTNQKKVLDQTGFARLLAAMQAHTKPIAGKHLGLIGEAHLRSRCAELGAEMESFAYNKAIGESDGVPWAIETAFVWRGEECDARRVLISGVNWSAALVNPFRQPGAFGQSFDTVLAKRRVDRADTVVFMPHAACPRVTYSDRGKSAVMIRR